MKTKSTKPRRKRQLSTLTIRRLNAIRRAILSAPKLYSQHEPFMPRQYSCRTRGCILGWAKYLFGKNEIGMLETVAQKVLVLSPEQATQLYGSFPDDLRKQYDEAPEGSLLRARTAAKRITHFIRTDGRE